MALGADDMVNQSAIQRLQDFFGGALILVIIGVAVIWVLSTISEGALQRMKPVIIFMIVCGFIGFVALGAFNGTG